MFLRSSGLRVLFIFLIGVLSGAGVGATDFEVGTIQETVYWNGTPTTGLFAGRIWVKIPGVGSTYLNQIDGTVTFENIVTGSHTIEFFSDGCLQDALKLGETTVTVSAGETVFEDFELSGNAGRISGTITVNGDPLLYPEISVPGQCGYWAQFSDGQFNQYLPPGTYTADVSSQSGYIGSFAFETIAGEASTIGASIGNTPPGSDVSVTAENPDGTPSPISLTFSNVGEGGTTTVTTSSSGPGGGSPEPSGFRLGNPATYYNINTTAEFTGLVEVCFNYSETSYSNESKLKLFHFTSGWTDITTSLDTENDIICGKAPSFSFFAAFEPTNTPPVAQCLNVTVAANEMCESTASVDGGSHDPDAGDIISLQHESPGPYGLGDTPVTLTVTDSFGESDSCSAMVTVEDRTAPEILSVTATPNVLWSPNHKMVPVTVSVSTEDLCSDVSCRIVNVTSNEAGSDDWNITNALELNLRAEREGGYDGRIYTINIECIDGYGNGETASTFVTVPHSQGEED